jgi:hypothetical protein
VAAASICTRIPACMYRGQTSKTRVTVGGDSWLADGFVCHPVDAAERGSEKSVGAQNESNYQSSEKVQTPEHTQAEKARTQRTQHSTNRSATNTDKSTALGCTPVGTLTQWRVR